MLKRIASACSVASLALLGILSGAAPANALGGGHYCFSFPAGAPYYGAAYHGYTQVEVNYNNTNWVAIESGQTNEFDGCFGFTMAPEIAGATSMRGVAHGIDAYGRAWYGTTNVYPPGYGIEYLGRFTVYCYSGC